jgi:transcriptional regulator with XRE-family HTH domain
MVNVNKLKSQMALMGLTQKDLADEMTKKGVKTSVNTLSSKMNGRSKFDCVDADVICEILKVNKPADKAEIFLA